MPRDNSCAPRQMAVLCESVELCRIFGASLRTASSRPRDQRRLPNRRKAKHSGP